MLSLPVAKTVVHRYHVYLVVRELQVFVTHTVTTMWWQYIVQMKVLWLCNGWQFQLMSQLAGLCVVIYLVPNTILLHWCATVRFPCQKLVNEWVTKNWRYQFNVCVLFSTFDLCEVAIVADKLNLPEVAKSRPPLSIPGKLLVPRCACFYMHHYWQPRLSLMIAINFYPSPAWLMEQHLQCWDLEILWVLQKYILFSFLYSTSYIIPRQQLSLLHIAIEWVIPIG